MSGKMLVCNDIVGTFLRRHKCAYCKVKLKRKKVLKIINSKSEEAKNYNFHMHRNTMTGDVNISWYEFECPICKRSFTLEELEAVKDI